ncbi:MAG: choice-of-anchor R domain-containing protein [Bacteriovoracia bacterium]
MSLTLLLTACGNTTALNCSVRKSADDSYDAASAVSLNIGSGDEVAQSFQVRSTAIAENHTTLTVSSVELMLEPIGEVSGNLFFSIQTDSGGAPSGTELSANANATVSITTNLTRGAEFYTFTLQTATELSPNVTYWLRLKAIYPVSTTQYVKWYADPAADVYDASNEGYSMKSNGASPPVFTSLGGDLDFLFRIGCTAVTSS